ncbi:MAG: glycine cleavage system aminomethyltransferase GcvT [Acidiferrobacteraceae bacterium]
MSHRTALYPEHLALGAKMTDFGGFSMPLHYGSQLEEHHAVRRDAGMFDVSHMAILDLEGPDSSAFLRGLLANDVAKLKTAGRALYTCMLNEAGGVIDDLIVYRMGDAAYRIVVNAATTDKDIAWMRAHLGGREAKLVHRSDLAMIAVQGPKAVDRAAQALKLDAARSLKPFHACSLDGRFVARTGYTGEDGFELLVPVSSTVDVWRALREAGVAPAGLGARDTLRLEAGMNLYGQDMDEEVNPLESGLAWTVAWDPPDRHFVGRSALEHSRAEGPRRQLLGIVLEGRGVPRAHQRVRSSHGEGVLTSAGFSPTLGRGIGFARVPADAKPGEGCEIDVRGRWEPARLVRYPFVRNGQSLI